MGMVVTVKSSSYVHLDPDTYVAKVLSVEQKESEKKFREDQDYYYQFKLLIENPLVDGNEVNPVEIVHNTGTNLTTHEKNKLGKFLKAIGFSLEEGSNIELEDCVGKRLRVVVEDKIVDDPKTNKKMIFSTISNVMPMKKMQQQVQQQQKPAMATKQQPKPAPKKQVVEDDTEEMENAIDDGLDEIMNM